MTVDSTNSNNNSNADSDGGERPIGIFNIDSEITKSFNSLQGLFAKNKNTSSGTDPQQQQKQRNNHSGRLKNSLLVFCPPTASAVGDDDDEQEEEEEEQHNSSRDLFMTPASTPTYNTTIVEQDTTVNRPDPTGQSPTKKGIMATPMIIRKKTEKTSVVNSSSSSSNNSRSVVVVDEDDEAPEEIMPGLAPSTPVLSPVNEEGEEGHGTTPSLATHGTGKEGTDGRFFADDSTVTVTSRTEDDETTTAATDTTLLRKNEPKNSSNSRHPFVSFLRMFMVIMLTSLAAYTTVGRRSHHHVQKLVATLEDQTIKYATKAKTNLGSVLKQYDIDFDPVATKVQMGLQNSYGKSQQVLQSVRDEITTFIVNTLGGNNIESLHGLSNEVQQVVVLRSEQITHAVSSIDMEDIFQGTTSKMKTFSTNCIESVQRTVSEAKQALVPHLQKSKKMVWDIYSTIDVDGVYQTTISQFNALSENDKVLQFKTSTREIVSLMMDYFYRFVDFVTRTIGQDNIHQFQQHQEYWTSEIETQTTMLVSQFMKYYEGIGVSNFLESHGLGSSSLKNIESDDNNVVKSPSEDAKPQEEDKEVEEIIDEEETEELDTDSTVEEEGAEEMAEPKSLVPDEGETAVPEDEDIAPKVSPLGADDYVPTEMISDYYDRIVQITSAFQPVVLSEEGRETNGISEEEPVVVVEEDEADARPESDSESDTAEGVTGGNQTPEAIIFEETFEPVVVVTAVVEDEALEEEEDIEATIEANDEKVDTEQYQKSESGTDATDIEAGSSGDSSEEEQEIPIILDEDGIKNIKLRMENARARMVEVTDDDPDNENTNNGGFGGFFRRFMK